MREFGRGKISQGETKHVRGRKGKTSKDGGAGIARHRKGGKLWPCTSCVRRLISDVLVKYT